MKMTEPYSPTARANASANPGQHRRDQARQDHPEHRVPAVGAERGRRLLDLDVEIDQHRLHRAHHEGNADEDHRDEDADRRERHLDAEFGQRRPEPAFLREQLRQRDAGDRGRQRKGDIDDGVEQPPAGKAVAHQRPDDDHPHHEIDQAAANARPNEIFSALSVRRLVMMPQNCSKAELERLEEQAGQRNQDDNGEPCQGQSHGETKPRQGAPPFRPSAHNVPDLLRLARSGSVLVDLVENAALGEMFLLRLGPTAENVVDGEQFNLGERFLVLLRDLAYRADDRNCVRRFPDLPWYTSI